MQAGFLGSCKKGAVWHLFCLFACFLDWVYNANMKKKVVKKEEVTNKDLAVMLGGLDTKVTNLGKHLDVRITRLESYMKQGFDSLDNKIDYVDIRFANQFEGLGRRIDDLADNKVSRISYKELESRVLVLESMILQKAKK